MVLSDFPKEGWVIRDGQPRKVEIVQIIFMYDISEKGPPILDATAFTVGRESIFLDSILCFEAAETGLNNRIEGIKAEIAALHKKRGTLDV